MKKIAMLSVASALPAVFANEAAAKKTSAAPVAPVAPATDAAKSKERVAPVLTEIVTGIELPARKSPRGAKSDYDFDALPVGGAIGIKNKDKKAISSIVSKANRASMQPKKDEAGNVVFKMQDLKAADGSVTKVPTSEPEMVATKNFFAYEPDAAYREKIKGTALEGATVIIFRDK